MSQTEHQDIAQRAVQRDPDAFAQIYDEHVDIIYRFVYYKVGDPGVAEDLTEDVFAKAWERIDRFQWRNVPVQHWLLTIARNTVTDHWRSRKRTSSPLDVLGEVASDLPSPDEHVARDLELESLGRALARLPDEQRDVLILRFIEDLSHKDVAAILGKSVVAVRQIQVRALRALQHVLTDDGAVKSVNTGTRGLRAVPRRDRPTGEEAAT
jgi:RNA polymerase sigma-70 factor (ECF subfamily)